MTGDGPDREVLNQNREEKNLILDRGNVELRTAMAYDEDLAARVRKAIGRRAGLRELSMMGGLCFMLRGHMCCGVLRSDVVVRVGPEREKALRAKSGARPMDFTGKPLRGFLFVGPGGHRTDVSLRAWIREAVDFARSLPPKKKAGDRRSV